MDRAKRFYLVLTLLILYSALIPESMVLADFPLNQITSKDSMFQPNSINTVPQERTQGPGDSLLIIGLDMERTLPSPQRINPAQVQQRTTTREPEKIRSDQFTTLKDACNKYAKDAVLQNQENLKLKCGLSGSRWSSDYNAHLNWCMSGNLTMAKGENTERQKALAECKKKRCDWYTKGAVEYNNYNLKYGCGFTGPQWNSNYNYHYNWCMAGDNIKYVDAEIMSRNKIYLPCDICRSYAEYAVSQNQYNIQHNCGLTGPMWNSNLTYHFRWCRSGDNYKLAQGERDKRDDALMTKCGKTTPPPPPLPQPPSTKTTIINGFKKAPLRSGYNIWYMAIIQIPNGILMSVKNPAIASLGKQWIVQIIPAGASSQDCGKQGKTIDIYPGASTTKLQNTPLTNLIIGFCLTTNDPTTLNYGLPNSWSLEITYTQ
jgi:hypothetical protein